MATVQDEQEGDREHGGQLTNEAERLDRDLLERARQVRDHVWQTASVLYELRGDVVMVVVVAERRVVA